MTTTVETHRFEAETQALLGLVIHSLYTEREIFLRELISNSSDALDRRRIEALSDAGLGVAEGEGEIRLFPDAARRMLTIEDDGIGMTREEMAANLGTIARSGTKAFLQRLAEEGKEGAAQGIGRFGVGFYSAFMVADEVEVVSRRAGTDEATRWKSRGDGTYTLEAAERAAPGTSIVLHLRAADPTEESPRDWTDARFLESVVKRHSDYIDHPIRMEVESWEIERDEDGKPVENGKREKTKSWKTLNARKPLWAHAPKDVAPEAYRDFYRHLTHRFDEPLETIHVAVDAPVEVRAVLFVPSQRGNHMFRPDEMHSRLQLYVRRVLVMQACEDLLPPWLRFVSGVVSSDDLPLNVSRQSLQASPLTQRIRRVLLGKVLTSLEEMRDDDRPRYERFWEALGPVLKEGLAVGGDDESRLAGLVLVRTAAVEGWRTLEEVGKALPEGQEELPWLGGAEIATLRKSPHLEGARKRGHDALLLSDPVDEWIVQRFEDKVGRPVVPLAQGEVRGEDEATRTAREAEEEAHGPLLKALSEALAGSVARVRFSTRLAESPAVLVADEGALGPAMERIMREMNQDVPPTSRTLELNAKHPVVGRLTALLGQENDDPFKDLAHIVLGQALLAEGRLPEDPTDFARRLAAFLGGDRG